MATAAKKPTRKKKLDPEAPVGPAISDSVVMVISGLRDKLENLTIKMREAIDETVKDPTQISRFTTLADNLEETNRKLAELVSPK